MKKLLLKEVYRKELNDLLTEMSVEELTYFSPKGKRMLKIFKVFYELEYKYNMLLNKEFLGMPQRKEKILNYFEEAAEPVIDKLTKAFHKIFNYWLEEHDVGESGIDQWMLSSFWGTTKEGKGGIEGMLACYGAPKLIREVLSSYALNDSGGGMVLNYENFAKDLKNKIRTGKMPATSEVITKDNKILVSKPSFLMRLSRLEDKILIQVVHEIAEQILYPMWKEAKSKEGDQWYIVQKFNEKLKKIKSLPLKKQFGLINAATNVSHYNGNIMDYFDDFFGVSKEDLTKLSQYSTRDWDIELREIGAKI